MLTGGGGTLEPVLTGSGRALEPVVVTGGFGSALEPVVVTGGFGSALEPVVVTGFGLLFVCTDISAVIFRGWNGGIPPNPAITTMDRQKKAMFPSVS